MSTDVTGFISWLRQWFDDIYAPKGSGGGGLDIDDVYPVGSIYMSVNNTSPSTLFGGTWVQLTDTFLYASTTSDANSTTATSGEATHTLSTNEMPSHTHSQNAHAHNAQQHTFLETNQGINNSSKRKMSYTSGDYYYPYHTVNGSWARHASTANTTATNQNTGGGQAHNNMPPYMKVFMWKRTA